VEPVFIFTKIDHVLVFVARFQ